MERLRQYLHGDLKEIEELEEELVPTDDWGLQYNLYCDLISFNYRYR